MTSSKPARPAYGPPVGRPPGLVAPTDVTVHVDSCWTASPGDLRGFIGDNALADTVEAFARETGAGVSYAMWDGGRSVSLVMGGGRMVLRLAAVMSANAAPPGVAGWTVTR